ncbi:MAG: hypothetical protein K6F69_04045 [Treponema sp.]|nr:hypothetical protein [Treponema sp.]
MNITDNELDKLIQLITLRTGIIPRESHKTGIRTYVNKKINELEKAETSYELAFHKYYSRLSTNNDDLMELINESTVNETYFFREEKQFQFLKNKIFSNWTSKKDFPKIKIWTAACSSGEEAYSLLLLAKACGLTASVIASDINTEVLKKCSEGIYKASSIRNVDGGIFKYLLDDYKSKDGMFKFPQDIKRYISTKQINLSSISMNNDIPTGQNIIFIRNVFIYFSREMRANILKTLAERCLAEDGYIFVSMNEVASIDSDITPDILEKISDGSVFCFHKKSRRS